MKQLLKYIAILIFLLGSNSVTAQVWNLRAGLGLMSYSGDLVANPVSFPHSHTAFRLGVGAEFYPRFAMELNYLKGRVSSSNVDNIDPLKQINFESSIDNYSLLFKYRLDKMNIHVNRWGLSVLFGGGMFFFDPIENIQNTHLILSEVQREGVAYSTSSTEFNLGGELAFMLSRKWILSAQSVFHFTSTDYLDDVSLRKDPSTNDNYADHTLSLIYRFGSEKAFKSIQDPLKCPAFFK